MESYWRCQGLTGTEATSITPRYLQVTVNLHKELQV
jgi:hypothetical protein